MLNCIVLAAVLDKRNFLPFVKRACLVHDLIRTTRMLPSFANLCMGDRRRQLRCVPIDRTYGSVRDVVPESDGGRGDAPSWIPNVSNEDECVICNKLLSELSEWANHFGADEESAQEVEVLEESGTATNPLCGHAFHRLCIRKLIETTRGGRARCPLCRTPIARSVTDPFGTEYPNDIGILRDNNVMIIRRFLDASAAGSVGGMSILFAGFSQMIRSFRWLPGEDGVGSAFENAWKLAAESDQADSIVWILNQQETGLPSDVATDILWLASSSGSESVVRLLLLDGYVPRYYPTADPRSPNTQSEFYNDWSRINQAVENAAAGGHMAVVRILMENGASDAWAMRGAAVAGNEPVVRNLMSSGTDPANALMFASYEGNPEAVRFLVSDIGVDVNIDDSRALLLASEQGHARVVEQLIDLGSNVNAADGRALLLAVRNQRDTTAFVLLEANTNATNTILIEAFSGGDAEMVELLLEMSEGEANEDYVRQNAESLLLDAVRDEKAEIVKFLIVGNYCTEKQKEEALNLAISLSDGDMVVTIVESSNFDERSINEAFLLSTSLPDYNIAIVIFFISRGVDLDYKNGSPVFNATKNNNRDLLTLLLKSGAKATWEARAFARNNGLGLIESQLAEWLLLNDL